MRYRTEIDPEQQELVLIRAHRRTPLVDALERLAAEGTEELMGYDGASVIPLDSRAVDCFVTEGGRRFAYGEGMRLSVRERLYELEERFSDRFVRINQSCLANVERIARFETTLAGTLAVVFRCGYRDYVSRRQMKAVKERMGIRL